MSNSRTHATLPPQEGAEKKRYTSLWCCGSYLFHGGEAADPEAQRGVGQVFAHANGPQHVRRLQGGLGGDGGMVNAREREGIQETSKKQE